MMQSLPIRVAAVLLCFGLSGCGEITEPTDPIKGKCWQCGGAGWTSENVLCPNCWKGESDYGNCPVCGGTAACDWCAGKKVLTMTQLKKKTKAPEPAAAGPADGATPPAE